MSIGVSSIGVSSIGVSINLLVDTSTFNNCVGCRSHPFATTENPDFVKTSIVNGSDGNPFFMDEVGFLNWTTESADITGSGTVGKVDTPFLRKVL